MTGKNFVGKNPGDDGSECPGCHGETAGGHDKQKKTLILKKEPAEIR